MENMEKRKMKKIVITGCAVVLAACAAQAQGVARDFNEFGKANAGQAKVAPAGSEASAKQIYQVKNLEKAVKQQSVRHARKQMKMHNTFGADYYACAGSVAEGKAAAEKVRAYQAANSERVPAQGEYVSFYQKSLDKSTQMTPERKAELEAQRAAMERKEAEKKQLLAEGQKRREIRERNDGGYAQAIENVARAMDAFK